MSLPLLPAIPKPMWTHCSMTDPFINNPVLRPEMQEFLEIDGQARLTECWERVWVPTPSTKTAFQLMQECLNAPPSGKPEGLVITGESDTGKSSTLVEFRLKFPKSINPDCEFAEHPVIYIRAPTTPDITSVYKSILTEIGFPLPRKADPEDLFFYTAAMIKGCNVGTIMVDEFQDIGGREFESKVIHFLRNFKRLMNETQRPFIVAGTQNLLDLLIREPQTKGRLDNVFKLKPFKFDEFSLILRGFDRMLPLRQASNFQDEHDLIQFAYSRSQGYIGRLSRLLHKACRIAIDTGEERVTIDILRKVEDRSIDSVAFREE